MGLIIDCCGNPNRFTAPHQKITPNHCLGCMLLFHRFVVSNGSTNSGGFLVIVVAPSAQPFLTKELGLQGLFCQAEKDGCGLFLGERESGEEKKREIKTAFAPPLPAGRQGFPDQPFNLNIELVRQGLCEVVIYEKRAKLIYQDELLQAQEQTKKEKLGIWSE